jgi:hypothetical protein
MRGKPFLRKSLKTTLTLASLMSFLKKKVEPSPKLQEEELTTELEITIIF